MKNKKVLIDIIIQFVLVASVTAVLVIYFTYPITNQITGNKEIKGMETFNFYTSLSNILVGIDAIVTLPFLFEKYEKGKEIPKIINILRFISVVALTLTFIVTAGFLGFIQMGRGISYFSLFKHHLFLYHFLNPVLAALSFLLLVDKFEVKLSYLFYSLIPSVIYAIVYMIMVVGLKVWTDFYNFTLGGRYYAIPFVALAVLGIEFLFAFIYKIIKQKQAKKLEVN